MRWKPFALAVCVIITGVGVGCSSRRCNPCCTQPQPPPQEQPVIPFKRFKLTNQSTTNDISHARLRSYPTLNGTGTMNQSILVPLDANPCLLQATCAPPADQLQNCCTSNACCTSAPDENAGTVGHQVALLVDSASHYIERLSVATQAYSVQFELNAGGGVHQSPVYNHGTQPLWRLEVIYKSTDPNTGRYICDVLVWFQISTTLMDPEVPSNLAYITFPNQAI
jgi:hypothetical protein